VLGLWVLQKRTVHGRGIMVLLCFRVAPSGVMLGVEWHRAQPRKGSQCVHGTNTNWCFPRSRCMSTKILKHPGKALSVVHIFLSLLLTTNLLSTRQHILFIKLIKYLGSWPAPFLTLSSLDDDCIRLSFRGGDRSSSLLLSGICR